MGIRNYIKHKLELGSWLKTQVVDGYQRGLVGGKRESELASLMSDIKIAIKSENVERLRQLGVKLQELVKTIPEVAGRDKYTQLANLLISYPEQSNINKKVK